MIGLRRFGWCSFLLLLVAALVVTTGCSKSSLIPVTGTVTLDGKPLDGAAISFVPAVAPDSDTAPAGQTPANGQTDASGKFTMGSVGGPGRGAGHLQSGCEQIRGWRQSDGWRRAQGCASRHHAFRRAWNGQAASHVEEPGPRQVRQSGHVRDHGRSETGNGTGHDCFDFFIVRIQFANGLRPSIHTDRIAIRAVRSVFFLAVRSRPGIAAPTKGPLLHAD